MLERRIYTGGTFDLFHSGHVNLLRYCHYLSGGGKDGSVVVSLNTDEFVNEFKGHYPIMSYRDREQVLKSCRYVDSVIENKGGRNSKLTIELIKPNIIVIGSDWASKDYYSQLGLTQEWLDSRGIYLVYVPYTVGISTTKLIEKTNG